MSRAPLAPHVAAPKYKLIQAALAPIVRISQEALDRMALYVGLSFDEVGWLGTVFQTKGGPNLPDVYVIDQVYMLPQAVHAATTEIDPSGQTDLAMSMLQEDGFEPDVRVNRLLVWGHSHVNMGTAPSGQDDIQMETFAQNKPPFMLRLIANKAGRVSIDLYDYTQGVIWLDLSWAIDVPEDENMRQEIAAELALKVRKLPPPPVKSLPPLQGTLGYPPRAATNPSYGRPRQGAPANTRYSETAWDDVADANDVLGRWEDRDTTPLYPAPRRSETLSTRVITKKSPVGSAGPFVIICDPESGDVIMASGRKPADHKDWFLIEPLESEYNETTEFVADYMIWTQQYEAWCAATGEVRRSIG